MNMMARRLQYTLPSRVKVCDEDLKMLTVPKKVPVDWTLVRKLPEWLRNFEVNYETIGFTESVGDLPRINGSALVVDKSMASAKFYEKADLLKDYKGVLILCDRAYPYLCRRNIVPTYVCQIDSSYLCMSFFDAPEAKRFMPNVKACIFAVTTHPLTIRLWHGRRVFFTPFLGDWRLTVALARISETEIMTTGGEVSTFSWILACALGANPIGLFGVYNSYDSLSETEYPGTPHRTVRNKYGVFYQDKVYEWYAKVHHALIRHAKKRFGVETVNCSEGGVMYSKWIKEMTLEDFVKEYS